MKGKVLGIFGLLLALCLITTVATSDPWWNPTTSTFLQPSNLQNLMSRTSMFGILGIGVAFVIITAGIDLSVGSLVCFCGVLLCLLLHADYVPFAESALTEITAETGEIRVPAEWPDLQPGERIRLSRARRNSDAVLIVQSATVQDGGTLIRVEERPKRDDSEGLITRLHPLEAVPAESVTSDSEPWHLLALHSEHPIRPRDQISLLHLESGKVRFTSVVEAADRQSGDVWLLRLRNSPGDRPADEYSAVVMARRQRMSIPLALLTVLAAAAAIGFVHGLLVTHAHLQPFVATLGGLMILRGVSRWLTNDNPVGLVEYSDGLVQVASGRLSLFTTQAGTNIAIPYPVFFLTAAAGAAWFFLNRTIWGRYLQALGRNEQAARLCGINTRRMTITAYVICGAMAALGGILFALDNPSVSPSSFGNWFELYAIAAAVLGGCSLRGGEGSIIGVVIGTAVMQVLNNMILLLGIPQTLEPAFIGAVIVLGVFADEQIRQAAARRRLRQSAAAS